MSTPFTIRLGGLVPPDEVWLLHFQSEDGDEDWGYLDEEDLLHETYQRAGSPYTVTSYQPREQEAWEEDDPDWYRHPSLTVEERNPSLCC